MNRTLGNPSETIWTGEESTQHRPSQLRKRSCDIPGPACFHAHWPPSNLLCGNAFRTSDWKSFSARDLKWIWMQLVSIYFHCSITVMMRFETATSSSSSCRGHLLLFAEVAQQNNGRRRWSLLSHSFAPQRRLFSLPPQLYLILRSHGVRRKEKYSLCWWFGRRSLWGDLARSFHSLWRFKVHSYSSRCFNKYAYPHSTLIRPRFYGICWIL